MMSDIQWIVVDTVAGIFQAEILRGLFEAQGIPVILSQEGAGQSVYPVTVGVLGEVQILVREQDAEEAQRLLDAYHDGALETDETFTDQETPQG